MSRETLPSMAHGRDAEDIRLLEAGKHGELLAVYYRAETGLLDLARVDPRVWEVWGEVVRARVADVLALRPRMEPSAPAAVMFRAAELDVLDLQRAGRTEPVKRRDEIDDLFLGG